MKIPFGLGCMYFSVKRQPPPHRFDSHQFVQEIDRALRSIPAISNLDIRENYPHSEEMDDFARNAEEDPFRVTWSYSRLTFDVHIPQSVQNHLACVRSRLRSEDFHVSMESSFLAPVSMVVTALPEESPSDAVWVVYEFIKRSIDSALVDLERVGPSPFHADFYIDWDTASGIEQISVEAVDGSGQTFGNMTVPCRVSSRDEAIEAAFYPVVTETSLFYCIQHLNSVVTRRWNQVQKRVSGLVDAQERSNMWRWLGARRASAISSAYVALARFEEKQAEVIDELRGYYAEVYTNGPSLLRAYMDRAIELRPIHDTATLRRLVEFIDSKATKGIELIVVTAAAVVGGVAGAIVTSWLSH